MLGDMFLCLPQSVCFRAVNRDAVHDAEGVRHLLYYVGEEMADVINEALEGGADISNRLDGAFLACAY